MFWLISILFDCIYGSNLRNPAVSSNHLLKMIVRLLKNIQLLLMTLVSVSFVCNPEQPSHKDTLLDDGRHLRNIESRMELHCCVAPCRRSWEVSTLGRLHL